MNKYISFYNGKRLEIEAHTSYEAQQLAVRSFGVTPKNAYKVSVLLVEKEGKPVTHSTASL